MIAKFVTKYNIKLIDFRIFINQMLKTILKLVYKFV